MAKKHKTPSLYGPDLAEIHIAGYELHWRSAASTVLEWLQQAGIDQGLIVDLGCGGGGWLAQLSGEGYDTCGIDVSPNMIARAKQLSPQSRLICGSCAEVSIPECDAITSIGEPLNYLGSESLIRRTIGNVYRALRPGGLFVFDVREPASGPVEPVNHIRTDEDWVCCSLNEEHGNQLTRQITSFRRIKGDQYRRDQETHRLRLVPREKMLDWLRTAGFRVRRRRSYGEYRPPPRLAIYVCRKP